MNAVGISRQSFQRPLSAKCPLQNLWNWSHHYMSTPSKSKRGFFQISLETVQNLLDFLVDQTHVNHCATCQYRFSHPRSLLSQKVLIPQTKTMVPHCSSFSSLSAGEYDPEWDYL